MNLDAAQNEKHFGLSLGKLASSCGALDLPQFLQIQANLFNAWLDKLRGLSSINGQLTTAPAELFDPTAILRPALVRSGRVKLTVELC